MQEGAINRRSRDIFDLRLLGDQMSKVELAERDTVPVYL